MSEQPPHNPHAETAVLGSCLIDPDAIIDVLTLKPSQFYNGNNRIVFESIVSLYRDGKPIDTLTVIDELKKRGQLDMIGGEALIVGLYSDVPSSTNAAHYGRIVQEAATRRELIASAGLTAKLAYDEETPIDEAISQAQSHILAVGEESQQDVESISDVADRYLERLEYRYNKPGVSGLPTGFFDIDKVTFGLQKPELTIVGARPGMGKTSLTNAIALNAAKAGKTVAIFNLEMSAEQLVQRLVSIEACVDLQSLVSGQLKEHEWPLVHEALARIKQSRIVIDDSAGLTPLQMLAKCQRIKARLGLDLAILDYLTLMKADDSKGNRVQEVTEISRGLKLNAKALNVPVVALAQLSRGCESRENKRPVLSDLRDSGSVEQDADNVWFIYREEYYKPDTAEAKNVAEINLAKHRNGPTTTIELHWNGQYAKFGNLQRVNLNGHR